MNESACPGSSKPDSLSLKALGHNFLVMEERVEVFIAKSSIASCTARVMLKFSFFVRLSGDIAFPSFTFGQNIVKPKDVSSRVSEFLSFAVFSLLPFCSFQKS